MNKKKTKKTKGCLFRFLISSRAYLQIGRILRQNVLLRNPRNSDKGYHISTYCSQQKCFSYDAVYRCKCNIYGLALQIQCRVIVIFMCLFQHSSYLFDQFCLLQPIWTCHHGHCFDAFQTPVTLVQNKGWPCH